MQLDIKKIAVVLAVALIVVIGLIVAINRGGDGTGEPANAAETALPDEEAMEQNDSEGTQAQTDEAQDEAQGTMYEGALAGLTEDEIAALAIAEEESSARQEVSGEESGLD